ncbi:MAG: hypothetical protein IKA79_01110 [Lentisphaeria bacterium]|nr:hypothetical protein [Lentisphaeria bacterium]
MLHRRKKSIRGSAIIESTIAIFVIFLVLGVLLQLFYFAVGQMLTDYAALRGIRSHIVGFREYLVRRVIQVSAVGASGNLIEPAVFKGDFDPTYTERSYINTYLVGWRWMEYEHWYGAQGHEMEHFKSAGMSTTFNHRISQAGDLAKITTKFSDYALLLLGNTCSCSGKDVIRAKYIPKNESGAGTTNLFFGNIDIQGAAAMRDYAPTFLQLGGY